MNKFTTNDSQTIEGIRQRAIHKYGQVSEYTLGKLWLTPEELQACERVQGGGGLWDDIQNWFTNIFSKQDEKTIEEKSEEVTVVELTEEITVEENGGPIVKNPTKEQPQPGSMDLTTSEAQTDAQLGGLLADTE